MVGILTILVLLPAISLSVGQSGDGAELESNGLSEKDGIIAFGVLILSVVVLVLLFTFVALCRICASERRERRVICARIKKDKRTISPDPEMGDCTHPREGNVKIASSSMTLMQPKPSESSPTCYINYIALAELGIPVEAQQLDGEVLIGDDANGNGIEHATDHQS